MRQHDTTFNSQISGTPRALKVSDTGGTIDVAVDRRSVQAVRRSTENVVTRPAVLQGPRSARESLVIPQPPLTRESRFSHGVDRSSLSARGQITFDEWEPCSYRARRDYVKKRCHTDRQRGLVYIYTQTRWKRYVSQKAQFIC